MFSSLGCSEEDSVPGGACRANQDCPAEERCVAGMCVAVGGCVDDAACGPGAFCDMGTCRPTGAATCSVDADCPPGQTCDPTTSTCLGAVCMEDPECAPPQTVCQAGRCVAGCAQANTAILCGPGLACDAATGRCASAAVDCQSDAECRPPSGICEQGQCIPGCGEIGGLQCVGGTICDVTTGRCSDPMCVGDADCAPPTTVCEGGSCVAGCGELGGLTCSGNTVCDTATGRCVPVAGPCTGDADCGPPASVCEQGQCIPGCTEVGGLQCSGGSTCNPSTGRCEGGRQCFADADCSPPATVCDMGSGMCVPGCVSTGCTMMDEVCDPQTGRCGPAGAPLNATCTVASDCRSGVCFDVGGSAGLRCVSACGSVADCPSGFTCYDFEGAHICLSSSLFSTASFAGPNGSLCIAGRDCASNFCYQNACTATCRDDGDCTSGCRWFSYTTNEYVSACLGGIGPGRTGVTCTDGPECRSGVCYGEGTCGDLCGSTADCPTGTICATVNYSECLLEIFGQCLDYAINLVNACVASTHGNDPNGTACVGDGGNCRDGYCLNATNQCTGLCARDADCPSTMVCGVEDFGTLGTTQLYTNVCVPRP